MLSKICPKCGLLKKFSEFSKSSARADGVRYECKPCAKTARAEWAKRNPERNAELSREWARNNKEKNRQKSRDWAAKNPERKKLADLKYRQLNLASIKKSVKAYRDNNRELIRERKAAYASRNPEKIKLAKRKHYEANRERLIKYSSDFKKNNRAYYNALSALRELRKKDATPPWLTDDQKENIRCFYEISQYLTENTGEAHHVDHIIPIMGKTVCGLHVPWNLQVLTAEENLKKGNRIPSGLRGWKRGRLTYKD